MSHIDIRRIIAGRQQLIYQPWLTIVGLYDLMPNAIKASDSHYISEAFISKSFDFFATLVDIYVGHDCQKI